MSTLLLLIFIAVLFFALEKLWPANALPRVRGWWARVALVNLSQIGIVVLAGQTWERWMQHKSVLHLSQHLGDIAAATIAYLVSCFAYYWWHRLRHESQLFWRLCHQLHHSPRRIELLTSFYKHPVEITINSLLSSAIVFPLLGCSVRAAAVYTLAIAVAEYFYHWNVRTPRWIGWFFQRPESHRVHHQHRRHAMNYADLPLIDWIFGTLKNPSRPVAHCGFTADQEARVAAMLAFEVVTKPRGPLPTCLGCRKRWACQAAKENQPAA